VEIFEMRVTHGNLHGRDWNAAALEPNLVLANTLIRIGGETDLSQIYSHTISLHGLARRYERCDEWEDVAVLRDLVALTQLQPDRAKQGQDCAITTQTGEWRGVYSLLAGDIDPPMPLIAILTWVPAIDLL
jgi:hypothetical protein